MAGAHATTKWRIWVLGACAVAGWSAVAAAQTFYKWTDDRGVVHFSDSAPSRSQNVEERNIHVAPMVTKPEDPTDEADADTAADSGQPKGKGGDGPAKIVIASRKLPRTGPSTMHVSGEVKNVGGQRAQAVSVNITAVDSAQGTSCLDEAADVTPGTLGPGETGNFDISLDSPCLYGQTKVSLEPVWE